MQNQLQRKLARNMIIGLALLAGVQEWLALRNLRAVTAAD